MFVVAGLGNIGLTGLRLLVGELGFEAVGVDPDPGRVEVAKGLGLEARVGGVLDAAGWFGPGESVFLTALPSSIAYGVLERLASRGFSVVDVSFFAEPPWGLHGIALGGGGFIVVDAGISPGLSNMLVGMLAGMGARRVEVYVGGVSADPGAPLGWAAAWSVHDLLEEYLRPARMIVDGRVVSVDPLDPGGWGRRLVEGLGWMEYFPSDGLRTLLETMGGMEYLAEYTLRWPGHLIAMKALRDLGFFSGDEPGPPGCSVPGRRVLEEVIVERCRGFEDVVVLEVVAPDLGRGYRALIRGRDGFTGMGLATASFQVAVAVSLYGRSVGPGLLPPERLVELGVDGVVIRVLERLGVRVEEASAG